MSLFELYDPELPALNFFADIAVDYSQFKKEFIRHMGNIDPLLLEIAMIQSQGFFR